MPKDIIKHTNLAQNFNSNSLTIPQNFTVNDINNRIMYIQQMLNSQNSLNSQIILEQLKSFFNGNNSNNFQNFKIL
jgi:hypothetical protein